MKRRKIIKLSAYVTSGALITSLLPGCKSDSIEIGIDGYTPSFVNTDQYKFIRDLADTLLPETDTPGALSVGLPQIYDTILGNIFTSEQKSEYSEKLSSLINFVKSKNNNSNIHSLSSEERISFITALDSQILNNNSQQSKTYKELKNRLIQYYLKTEEVGTTLLNYLPVPGEYQACISLEETGGKAWAL